MAPKFDTHTSVRSNIPDYSAHTDKNCTKFFRSDVLETCEKTGAMPPSMLLIVSKRRGEEESRFMQTHSRRLEQLRQWASRPTRKGPSGVRRANTAAPQSKGSLREGEIKDSQTRGEYGHKLTSTQPVQSLTKESSAPEFFDDSN